MSRKQPASIRVRVGDRRQLFNSMDPSPFLDRDLDPDCEEFIVSWAREFRPDRALRIEIHFDREPEDEEQRIQIREAVRRHFEHAAELEGLKLRRMAREGRSALLVGLLVLAACTMAATLVPRDVLGAFGSIVAESLIVAGWVAMWRPLEILLYELWPIRRERRLFQRLASAEVALTSSMPAPSAYAGAR